MHVLALPERSHDQPRADLYPNSSLLLSGSIKSFAVVRLTARDHQEQSH